MELWEREFELDRLSSLLAGAADGNGCVVLVRGEAGIGKTTLVRRFVDSLGDDARVLIGWCDDLATPRELGPLWDMTLDEPGLVATIESGDRSRLYSAAVELIGHNDLPTVFVIEDVQWADGATLDLIKVLGRRIDRSRCLLLLTYRDEELDADHRLRLVFGDLPPHAVERLALSPLSDETIEQIAAAHRRDGALLIAESGGNPFYLSELLATEDHRVPTSIQDAIRSRVNRALPATRELVELISVVPGGAPRSLVQSLDEADARGVLIVDDYTVSFKHEVARRAIESGLSPARRRRLNAHVLSVLVAQGAPPARIVHHAVEAGDEQAIVEFASLAGRGAMSAQSYSEALSHFRRLAPHLDGLDAAQRAELLEQWSYAAEFECHFMESVDCARSAVDSWRDLDDARALGRALRRLSRSSWNVGDRDGAEAAAGQAISVLEGSHHPEELAYAYSSSATLDMLAGSAGAVAKAEKVISIAEEAGADLVRAHAMVTLGTALSYVDQPSADRALAEAGEFARRIGAEYEFVRSWVNRAWVAIEHRQLTSASAHIDYAIGAAFEHNLTDFELYGRATKGLIDLYRGNWLTVGDLASDLAPAERSPARIVLLTVVGTVRARSGAADAPALLDEAWDLATTSQELQRTGYAAAGLAELSWIRGETDEIGPSVVSVLEHARDVGLDWMAGALAYWAWKLGVIAKPPDGVSQPHALQIGGEWERAAEAWEALGMPYERALALSEGTVPARLEALAALDQLGADAVAAKLRMQLRREGVRQVPRGPQAGARAHPAGLTPRQSEILQLLAAGMSNPEVADRLFISARTVEQHVSGILAKLTAASRDEAVTVARGRGLLEEK